MSIRILHSAFCALAFLATLLCAPCRAGDGFSAEEEERYHQAKAALAGFIGSGEPTFSEKEAVARRAAEAKLNELLASGPAFPMLIRMTRELPEGLLHTLAYVKLIEMPSIRAQGVDFIMQELQADPDSWYNRDWLPSVMDDLVQLDPAATRRMAWRILEIDRYSGARMTAYTYMGRVGTADDVARLENQIERLRRNPIPTRASVNVDVVEGEKALLAIKARLASPPVPAAGSPKAVATTKAQTESKLTAAANATTASPLAAQEAPSRRSWWFLAGGAGILAVLWLIRRARKV